MNKRKLLKKVLANPKDVRFSDIESLIEAFGFQLARITGSHHIFEHPDLPEIINVQNRKGKAKGYQVRQFLELVEQYNLQLREDA